MRLLLLALLAAPLAAQDLASAVDLPTAKERRRAAAKLASSASLEDLLAAMRRFRPRGPAPEPGTFTEGAVTVYVPATYRHDRPAPLLVAFHGAGGDGRFEHKRWQDTADALGMCVVAPTGSAGDGYAFTEGERAEALAAIRWARRRLNVDENRIHLTGISRGGHLTWDIGLRRADRWASLAPMVGSPRLTPEQGQNNLRFLENATHLSIRDLQGLQDDPNMIFNLNLAFRKLHVLGALDAELLTFPELGHSFRFDAVDWKTFYAEAKRNPVPARVVRQCASVEEGRAFWAEVLKLDRRIKETFVPRVKAEEWNGLDADGRKEWVAAAVESGTARLEVRRQDGNVFQAVTYRVKKFRLLLADGMYDPDERITVVWNGKTITKQPPLSKRVLVQDFAERFDRTYLPVAEVTIP